VFSKQGKQSRQAKAGKQSRQAKQAASKAWKRSRQAKAGKQSRQAKQTSKAGKQSRKAKQASKSRQASTDCTLHHQPYRRPQQDCSTLTPSTKHQHLGSGPTIAAPAPALAAPNTNIVPKTTTTPAPANTTHNYYFIDAAPCHPVNHHHGKENHNLLAYCIHVLHDAPH
jgi:hypothetical protein